MELHRRTRVTDLALRFPNLKSSGGTVVPPWNTATALEGTLQSCWGDFLLALWVEAGDLERNNLGDTGGKGYGQDNMVVLRNLIGSVPDDRNLGRTRLPRMLSVRYSTKYPR